MNLLPRSTSRHGRPRTRRLVLAATAAAAAAILPLGSAARSSEPPAVAIIHPMPPLGNIDCCH